MTGQGGQPAVPGAPGPPDEVALSPEIPIVVAASASWDTPSPVNAHQIARRLAERGHEVLFVESAGLRRPAPLASRQDRLRILRRVSGWFRPVSEVQPRLHVLSPIAFPLLGPRWLRIASLVATARAVAGKARRFGVARPILWAFLPTHLYLARRLESRLTIYQCVDHYAANPGVDGEWLEELEAKMLTCADLVVATSPVLAERLRRHRSDVHLSENVADVSLFSRALMEALPEPPELVGLPRPRLVYVGNLAAYRIDFELLLALARARPDLPLVLVGALGLGDVAPPPRAWHELAALPHVQLHGPCPQAELPALLQHCDVALIPFLENDHTRASLPLKLWEYLAAGLSVVATDLPNFRALSREGTIRTARGHDAFLVAVKEALEDPPERRGERLARARAHDWPARMEALRQLVATRLAERSPGIAPPSTPET